MVPEPAVPLVDPVLDPVRPEALDDPLKPVPVVPVTPVAPYLMGWPYDPLLLLPPRLLPTPLP